VPRVLRDCEPFNRIEPWIWQSGQCDASCDSSWCFPQSCTIGRSDFRAPISEAVDQLLTARVLAGRQTSNPKTTVHTNCSDRIDDAIIL
jgi:hypothetical protein